MYILIGEIVQKRQRSILGEESQRPLRRPAMRSSLDSVDTGERPQGKLRRNIL